MGTHLNYLKFLKAYIVGTLLNHLNLLWQLRWVPTTYAVIKTEVHVDNITDCNLKPKELLDCALTGICVVIRLNMVATGRENLSFHKCWLHRSVLMLSMHSKMFSRQQFKIFFLFFQDFLLRRQFAWNVKVYVLGKISKISSICHLLNLPGAGLGGSVGCAVRLETRRSRVQPPPRSATFFRGDWSWNIFYGHSLPSADSRRAVVSFWRKNVHNTG